MRTTPCLLLLCAALAGCARPPATPGYFFPPQTIVRIPDQPGRITYDYARMNGSDFPYAIAAAERECRPDAKHAHVASVLVTSPDRARVTLTCL
jgi:hypothetical protein